MKKFLLSLILLMGLVTPCIPADASPKPDIPLSEEEQKMVTDAISARLRDPYSAKIECVGKLVNGGIGNHNIWLAIANVNAKNAFGAYVGMKPMGVFLVEGQICSDVIDNINDEITMLVAKTPCNKIVMERNSKDMADFLEKKKMQ